MIMPRGQQLLMPVRPAFIAFSVAVVFVLSLLPLGGLVWMPDLLMLVLATFYTSALALAGFELALPLGVFTGLAIFIPYLGFGLGAALALLAGVLQFASLYGAGAVLLIYGVGQVLESFVLTPRLVGERIGLHPIAVIFALLAFGHLFGFVGVLLALPAGALVLVALRRVRRAYVDSRLYRG